MASGALTVLLALFVALKFWDFAEEFIQYKSSQDKRWTEPLKKARNKLLLAIIALLLWILE